MTTPASAPALYPAVQVVVPGPMTTAHRLPQGVREASLPAAEYLRTEPASLILVDVSEFASRGARPTSTVVYTFTTRAPEQQP